MSVSARQSFKEEGKYFLELKSIGLITHPMLGPNDLRRLAAGNHTSKEQVPPPLKGTHDHYVDEITSGSDVTQDLSPR